MRKAMIAILLLLPVKAQSAEITCRKSPALIGQCRIVRGSLRLNPGVGVVLQAEDGTRILIKAPPDSDADIAPVVMQNWLYWQSKTGEMSIPITGAFQVCPLPPAINTAGIKDFGCIQSGSHIAMDKSAGAAR